MGASRRGRGQGRAARPEPSGGRRQVRRGAQPRDRSAEHGVPPGGHLTAARSSAGPPSSPGRSPRSRRAPRPRRCRRARSRKSTMFWAVTGPIPSIVSSSSSVAEPMLIGPDASAVPPRRGRGGRRARAGPPAGRRRAGGEVDRVQPRVGRGAARPLDGVGHARACRQAVDAGVADGAGDVDDDVLAARVELDRAPPPPSAPDCSTPPSGAPSASAERIQRAPTRRRATATRRRRGAGSG